MNPDLPKRKHPVHHVSEIRGRSTIVFVTVCTHQRQPVLANEEIHHHLRAAWERATAWRVERYVIMPDHLHFFAGLRDTVPLENWMRYWKSLVTKSTGKKLWQPGYWDRTMRSDESLEEKWQYMVHNPVRHGLVKDANQWPYQGIVFRMD